MLKFALLVMILKSILCHNAKLYIVHDLNLYIQSYDSFLLNGVMMLNFILCKILIFTLKDIILNSIFSHDA